MIEWCLFGLFLNGEGRNEKEQGQGGDRAAQQGREGVKQGSGRVTAAKNIWVAQAYQASQCGTQVYLSMWCRQLDTVIPKTIHVPTFL